MRDSGEVLLCDAIRTRKKKGPLYAISQLTRISQPGVALQIALGTGGQTHKWPAILNSQGPEKILCKLFDIFWSVPQRRNVNVDDIDTVEQIFPEIAASGHLLQVTIGRRYQTE